MSFPRFVGRGFSACHLAGPDLPVRSLCYVAPNGLIDLFAKVHGEVAALLTRSAIQWGRMVDIASSRCGNPHCE